MHPPIRDASSLTRVRVEGRERVYFGGCDYLGLAHHPAVIDAFCAGARHDGVSPGAARATSGDHVEYGALEAELASFLGAGAALLVGEGALANLVAAECLAPHAELALFDEHTHATGRQALRAAGFEPCEFPHLDLTAATRMAHEGAARGVLLWTDGVFPSRGTVAPLAAYASAASYMVVDDAHGFGTLGPCGRGSAKELDLVGGKALLTGTFSKALGTYGGFLVGPRALIDAARSNSPTLTGTTPPPVAIVRATRAALKILVSEPQRVDRLRANRARIAAVLAERGFALGDVQFPVLPFAPKNPDAVFESLMADGYLVPLTEYPGDDPPRLLRLTVRAEHSEQELDGLIAALKRALG